MIRISPSARVNISRVALVAGVSLGAAACASDDVASPSPAAEPASTADSPGVFADYAGSWAANEPFMRSAAMTPVADAIAAERDDYTPEAVVDLLVAVHDVGYTTVEVTSNAMAFFDSDTLICHGTYTPADAGEGASNTFKLADTVDGDCSNYRMLRLGDRIDQTSDDEPPAHFHLTNESVNGPIAPPPWDPAVIIGDTTPAEFTDGLMLALDAFVNGLPDNTQES